MFDLSYLIPAVGVCGVPVYGVPQHQAVLSVEIFRELGNSSVAEVVAGLQGAVRQHFVLPLSQNQQAVTTCRHNLHTNTMKSTITIIIIIRLLNTVSLFFRSRTQKCDWNKVRYLMT